MPLLTAWLPALLIASIAPAAALPSPLHSQLAPCPCLAPSTALDPALDPEREYAKGKEEAQAALLVELEEFAAWCQKEKCLSQRNRAYEVVITIDPNHKLARKCLKYKRDRKTKEWIRKGKYKEPKAGKPEARAEAAKRRTKINEPYVDALLALLDTHGELLKVSFVQDELDTLLALAPEQAALRARLGYIFVNDPDADSESDGKAGRWVLEETQYAKTERARIAKLLAEFQGEEPAISKGELTEAEKTWGIEWSVPLKSKKIRVVIESEVEGGEEEARKLIENMDSSWELFAQLTGSKSKSPEAFTVYLLSGDTKVPGLIKAYAEFSDSEREFYRGLYEYSDSLTIGRDSIVCYRESAEHRLDTAIAEWVNFYLFNTYGVSFVRGWASVGMRHYVTELVLGTRITFPDGVDASPEMQRSARGGKLPDALSEARKVMAKASTRYVRDLLELTTYNMADEEIVASHALFAYVIEGHDPEVSHKLLRNVARSVDLRAANAFEESLDMPIEVIQMRFTTWLDEMKGQKTIQASSKPKEAGPKKK